MHSNLPLHPFSFPATARRAQLLGERAHLSPSSSPSPSLLVGSLCLCLAFSPLPPSLQTTNPSCCNHRLLVRLSWFAARATGVSQCSIATIYIPGTYGDGTCSFSPLLREALSALSLALAPIAPSLSLSYPMDFSIQRAQTNHPSFSHTWGSSPFLQPISKRILHSLAPPPRDEILRI